MTKTKQILSVFLSVCMIFSCMAGMSLTAYAGGGGTEVTQANVICQQYSYFDAGSYSGGAIYDTPPVEITNITLADAQAFGAAVTCPTTYWVVVYATDGDNLKWTSNGKTGEQTSTPYSASGTVLSAWYELYNDDVFDCGGNCDPNRDVTFYFSKGLATVPVTGVTLNPSTAQTIEVNGKVSFTATVEPNNATDRTVKWSVVGAAVKLYSDANCENELALDTATETLTVYAKGISAGNATVTATSNANNTISATCDVTVNAASATPAETLLTTLTFGGSSTYSETTSGVVSVTATNVTDYTARFGWIWYEEGSLSVTAKEGYTITKCVFIQNAKTPITDTEAPFEIHGSRNKITEDTKRDMDGVTSIEVYGYANAVAVTSVSISPSSTSLTVGGDAVELTATVTPDNATDKTVTWTSSDTSVATVENGVVTAVGAGTATITAKAGGKSATCEVTVSASDIDISNGTVTVNTSAKTVTVTVDGNTVPADAYHIIYFTYEKIEGGETVNRVGTDFPTTAGTYIAAVVANENSGYTGENRSEPFTVSSGNSGGNSGGYTPSPSTYYPTTTTTTNTGSFADETKENTNYSGAEINMKSDELEKAVLTDEDKKVIDAGGTVTVELEVEEMTPTAEEKKEVEAAVEAAKEASGEDYTVAMYFDANLFKTSNGTKSQLHETNGKIAVSFKLPAQFKNTDSSVTRTYAVARIHDGKTEILVCEYDPETDLLTFYTDKFSVYALMFDDTAVEEADVSAADDKTLSATVSRTGNVKLSWSAQTGAESYSVYQAKDGKWVKLGTTSKTTYTVKNLTNNKTYRFMVRAKVNGKLVAKADAMTLKLKVYYKPVVKATTSDGRVTLKWAAVPNATKYRVYMVKDGEPVLLKETTKLKSSGIVKSGKTYRFAVKAYVDGKWTSVKTSDIVKIKAK